MKKRLSVFLSLILAFVLGFALIACGTGTTGDNGGNGDNKDNDNKDNSVVIMDELKNAVSNLVTATGYKGTAKVEIKSDGGKAADVDAQITKNGDYMHVVQAKTTDRDAIDMYVNLDNGYMYTKEGDAYNYMQVLPQGALDYVDMIIKANMPELPKISNDDIGYDATTKTISFKLDAKDTVNGLIAPLAEAMTTNPTMTIEQALNKYLKVLKIDNIEDVDGLIAVIESTVTSLKEQTLGDCIAALEKQGIDIYGQLEEQMGKEMVDSIKPVLNARKVKDAIVAAYTVLTAEEEEPVEGMEQSMMGKVIAAVLAGEVNQATVDADFAAAVAYAKGYLESMLSMPVKNLIGLLEEAQPELYALIANNVQFSKLSVDFSLKFNDDYKIAELNFTALCSHNYKGKAESGLLADNNYSAIVKLAISEYATAAEPVEITLGEGTPTAMKLIYGQIKSDVTVKLEGTTLPTAANEKVAMALFIGNPENVISVPEVGASDITFDADKKTVTIKASYINKVLAEVMEEYETTDGLIISVGFALSEENYYAVQLINMPEDVNELGALIGSLMGSSAPGDDNVIEGGYEDYAYAA